MLINTFWSLQHEWQSDETLFECGCRHLTFILNFKPYNITWYTYQAILKKINCCYRSSQYPMIVPVKWSWLWNIIPSLNALSPLRNMCFIIQALGSTQHKQPFNAAALIVSSNQRRSSKIIKCKKKKERLCAHSSSFEVNSSWTLLCWVCICACRQCVTDLATVLFCLSLH